MSPGLFVGGFVAVTVAALIALFVVAGASEDAGDDADIALTGQASQRAFEGLRVVDDDDGSPTDPPQVRGPGLVDRVVGIRSLRDEPIELAIDPDDAAQASEQGATARVGFLAGAAPGRYPSGRPPRLTTTIPARGAGALVLRVRVRACARPEGEPRVLAAGLRLVRGPGAERDARVQARESDGSLLAEPAARTPLGDQLQVVLPGCTS